MDITNEEAERIMIILKQRGLLEKIRIAEERDFITYLLDFYDYDTSPYVSKNPWDDGFIFYSDKENQPMDHKLLNNGLREVLIGMGISKEEQASRNIVFHSWRHRYASKMADLVDARSLGLATGHKTQSMLEHYADHANENHFQAVREASEKAFGQAR